MFNVAVFGYGGRGKIYADNFKQLGVTISAVCDLSQIRLDMAKEAYGCEVFNDEEQFFSKKRADVLIIATLDDGHYLPCIRALKTGYDVILEKPISFVEGECREIVRVADLTGKSVSVCHVLRYAPFYTTIKKLCESNEFGKIIHLTMTENVGYYHFAHSYVRGPWRNKKISAPVILAKSCHDLDMITWLIGKKCISVSSFGDLSFFKKEHAPKGATANCVDCPHQKSCEYSCYNIYLNKDYEKLAALARHGRLGSSDEEIVNSLNDRNNAYGRCVFYCDNDVFDHQSVSMQFEDNVLAQFCLSAFSQNMGRSIHLYCEKGEIYGDSDSKKVYYTKFGDPKEHVIEVSFKKEIYASHGGGDMGLVQEFVNGYGGKAMVSDIHQSIQSHEMGFAAERSAQNKGKVEFLK